MKNDYPILEFDSDREGIIKPSHLVKPLRDIPDACVLCFFQDVINRVRQYANVRSIKKLKSEIGTHPVYAVEHEGSQFALLHPGVGAPLCAALFEEVLELGCKKFITCGSAGVLDGSIAMGHLLVPSSAVRDEGTSYHYLPPGREVRASAEALGAIDDTMQRQQRSYRSIKIWSTDAIYRETPAKIDLRRSEGCLAVDMETAALFAVAEFCNVPLGAILYAGDDISGSGWQSRGWVKQREIREQLFWLAAEASLKI